ncbi:hypothetical protein JOD45_002660 [Scopulibacillus daqui]|uniref:Lumazine-binding protein n=1 Tax=Scopulibacillus daqui TaxID=1469162 RepID=A0ABS2Q4L4_9BACL|nr:hypothetical protein [Scopulibacillus daqui]MBM7646432.1 hypothetical protein [Scopulibacillus daqui]
MKHKQGEREIIAQGEKVAKKYLKEKEGINHVKFKDYSISPMRVITLDYINEKSKKEISVDMIRHENGQWEVLGIAY